jgi:ComEC/Rec2-related protein
VLSSIRKAYLFRRPVVLFLIAYAGLIVFFKSQGFFDRVSTDDPSYWTNKRVEVCGIVVTHPDPRPRSTVVILQAETIRIVPEPGEKRTPPRTVRGKILLDVVGHPPPPMGPGDRVVASGRLQKPRGAIVPGTFDYSEWLANQNIHTVMYVGRTRLINTGNARTHFFQRWAWRLHEHVARVFRFYLSDEESTVLAGLVIGDRPRFHPEIRRIFIQSGTMHILVASGSNVAFVLGLWYLLMRVLFRFPRRWAILSGLPSVGLYVLLVGADAPIIRAGIMTTVGVIAYVFAREDRPYQPLALAALAILLPNPKALFDVGFQMSFSTVFGIIYFVPRLDPVFAQRPIWFRWMGRLIVTTLAAQVWLFPITTSVFKQVSLTGFISNTVILPLSVIGLPSGFLLTLLDFALGPTLTTTFAWAVAQYLDLVIWLVTFFAHHMGHRTWVAPPHPMWIMGFYLCCFSVVDLRKSWVARIGFIIGLCMVAAGFFILKTQHPIPKNVRLTWIPLGRGLCFISQKADKNILIFSHDPPTLDQRERTLLPFLATHHISSIDEEFSLNTSSSIPIGEIFPGPVWWIQYDQITVLLAKTIPLKTQDLLIKKNITGNLLMQCRFSEKTLWRENFVKKFLPNTVIETGYDSPRRPSRPPWKNIPVIVPHKTGPWIWEEVPLSGSRAAEKPNQYKS